MAGFISEFLVFRGSITEFPLATLLSMVGSGLTAVYFLLLVNRAFFGRLAVTPSDARSGPLDIRLPTVNVLDQVPSLALALSVVLIGLWPAALGRISEAATNGMALLPTLLAAGSSGGVG
jgi:NAD(P)H-quinone oxidoreductase subunit 4